MGFPALYGGARRLYRTWINASIPAMHTARGFDLAIGGHQTFLDAVALASAFQTGNPLFIGLAAMRLVMEVMATAHGLVSLMRDHRNWWRSIKRVNIA